MYDCIQCCLFGIIIHLINFALKTNVHKKKKKKKKTKTFVIGLLWLCIRAFETHYPHSGYRNVQKYTWVECIGIGLACWCFQRIFGSKHVGQMNRKYVCGNVIKIQPLFHSLFCWYHCSLIDESANVYSTISAKRQISLYDMLRNLCLLIKCVCRYLYFAVMFQVYVQGEHLLELKVINISIVHSSHFTSALPKTVNPILPVSLYSLWNSL